MSILTREQIDAAYHDDSFSDDVRDTARAYHDLRDAVRALAGRAMYVASNQLIRALDGE